MDVEELREQVEAISASVEKLLASGINEDLILTLIQECAPTISAGYRSRKKVPKRTIAAVLEGMERLDEYVFPADSDE